MSQSIPFSSDLFEQPETWRDDPVLSFASWLAHQDVAFSTRHVRVTMWKKFMRWLTEQNLSLSTCEAAHIKSFLTWAKLEKEHAWRYVRLIEQTYDHLHSQNMALANPARKLAQQGVGNRANAKTRFLDAWERDDVLLALQDSLLPAKRMFDGWSGMRVGEQAILWQQVRDATMAALMFGAGVKVHEVEHLSCQQIFDDPTTHYLLDNKIQILGKSGIRRAPLFPIAVLALEIWQQYRPLIPHLGDPLFPAMLKSRRSDLKNSSVTLHPSNIFRRVRHVFSVAGIDGGRTCGQTLRNSYVAQLIEMGMSDDAIIEAMGYLDRGEFTVPRLRYEHQKWLESIKPHEELEPEKLT